MPDDQITYRPSDDNATRIEEFRARRGHETLNDTLDEMVQVADRETRHPHLWRAKHAVTVGIEVLAVLAVVAILSGLTTDVLTPWTAGKLALMMVAVAGAMSGGLAALRLVLGQAPASPLTEVDG